MPTKLKKKTLHKPATSNKTKTVKAARMVKMEFTKTAIPFPHRVLTIKEQLQMNIAVDAFGDPIEAALKDLKIHSVGLEAGANNNQCFAALNNKMGTITARFLYLPTDNVVENGYIHLRCSEDEAEEIIADLNAAGGSAFKSGVNSPWEGFIKIEVQ